MSEDLQADRQPCSSLPGSHVRCSSRPAARTVFSVYQRPPRASALMTHRFARASAYDGPAPVRGSRPC